MKNTIPWDHFSRAYKLLFSNALITVPLIAAFFINQAAQFMFHPTIPNATLLARICASFITIFAFSLAYTTMVGMTQAALAQRKASFQDGVRAASESLDRIVLVTIMLFICSTIYTISSTFVKQSLINQASITSIMTSFAMLPLAFAASFALSFFLLYTGPLIIIGRKTPFAGIVQSAKIASQNTKTNLTIAILFYCVLTIGYVFLLSNDFYNSQIFQLTLFLLIFSPSACFTNFVICGQFMKARRFPISSAEKSRNKYAVILPAIAYIAIFSSLSVIFPANEIISKTISLPAYFQPKTDDISIAKDLQNFITETRSVKINRVIERHAINDAYGMILPHSDAYKYLETWFPTHNPFTIAHSKIKFIYGLRVRPGTQANTYDITWHEAVANPSTKSIRSSEQWEAKIQITPGPTHEKYFITQLSWQKI